MMLLFLIIGSIFRGLSCVLSIYITFKAGLMGYFIPPGGVPGPPRRKGDLPGGFPPFRARGLAFDKGENP